MIELNMLAKPFNPLEWFLPKKLLKYESYPVGSGAWSCELVDKEHQDALIRHSVGNFNTMVAILHDDGWLPCPIPMLLPSTMFVYQKGAHKLFVTGSPGAFDKMLNATQVCKMAKLNHIKDYFLAINIHISIMCGKKATPAMLEQANKTILWDVEPHPVDVEVPPAPGELNGWLAGFANNGGNNN
jgi:hypothetical protein